MDFKVGTHFPMDIINEGSLMIPNSINANGILFKNAWDLLIELDVCELLGRKKEVHVDEDGVKYTGDDIKKFYFNRRLKYHETIYSVLKKVDYTTIVEDLDPYVSKEHIKAILNCILDYFVPIEHYEICADIKKFIDILDKNGGLMELVKDIIDG